MVSTEYYNVVDALVALLLDGSDTGTVTLAELDGDGNPIEYAVYDGVPVSEKYPLYAVFVGWDASPDGEFQSADIQQQWAGSLGAKRRDETIDVVCALVAGYGNGDRWKPARDLGLAIQRDVETKLRQNVSLGLEPTPTRQYLNAEFKPAGAFQEPYSETGFWFRLSFTVSVQTRT
ncbi:hypothetical protein ACIOD2_32400 [Amycolatopsis sp. NPDC088138]|uniref:hypothetical protein n=1 Tax=Amycolatopsis sp. NPDC088138 TaxID=3363938 RepID=UPI00381F9B14